uniref:Reverse transcriptase zinc-binding domain-containing protein n=1 Tax=Lotus japonicus TaxID=34305 RepID=I3SX42_LOTJA|nr:unknown [Lotus japonicus]
MLDRIQTQENLRKRSVIQLGTSCLCLLCLDHEESLSHLLFSCRFAWCVWMEVYKWLGVRSVLEEEARTHYTTCA